MSRTLFQPSSLIFCLAILIGTDRSHADWPSWRGSQDKGSIDQGEYPEEVGDNSLLWRTALPGKGCSTPIVVDEKILLTAPIDGKDGLLAIDLTGAPLWQATFDSEVAGKHRNGSGSNASPVSDGQSVFVYFKSGTLAALDLEGTVRWRTNLVDRFGKDTLFWDHGTSPVLTQEHVVFARMHQGESWLAAFDKQTGEMRWKVARNYEVPTECDHGYSTPLVIEHNGKESLLVWGAQHVTIHDAQDGRVVWSCGGFNLENNRLWPSIATPVIVGNIAVIAYGRNDRKIPRLHGLRLEGSGDVTATHHQWLRDDIGTFVPSPVAYQNKVYLVRDRGEVACVDPTTGSTIWSDALPKSRSNYYASPLIANGKLYAPREDGIVFVASVVNDRFKILSENDLGQPIIGSPVPVENGILLRGEKELLCFGSR